MPRVLGAQVRVRVDLQQPHAHVFIHQEVVTKQLEAVLAAVGVQCRFHREEGVDDTLLPSTTTSGAGTHAQAYTQPQHQDTYLDPRP